jgi:hypothetical protein
MTLGILLGIAGFTLFVLSHWALFHWRVLPATFKNLAILWMLSLLAAWIAGGLSGALLPVNWAGHPLVRATTILLVFACCFVLYMPFYYTVATSLSVQTMILVDEAGPNGLPLSYLQNLFASQDVLDARLAIMVANGYLIQNGDRFQVTGKGTFISRVFGGLKSLWRLGAGG